MKWILLCVIFVLCSFNGISSAPAVEDEATTPITITSTVAESIDETTSPSPSTTAPPPPETPSSTEPVSEAAVVDVEPTTPTPEVTTVEIPETEVAPTPNGDSSSGAEVASSTIATPEAAAESLGTTAAPDTDVVMTTTAESWLSSWFSPVSGSEGTTEAGITTTDTSIVGSSDSDSSTITTTEEAHSTTTEEASVDASSTTTEPPVPESLLPTTMDPTAAMAKSQGVAFKLSDQIRAVLLHYQNPDPIGFPGAPVPDPMSIPEMKKSFGVAQMTFKDIQVYGLSRFRIDQVNTDLEKNQVYVQLHIKRLVILGNYTLRSWWNKAAGPFTVNLYDVVAEGAAALQPDEQGHLQASDTDMDMTFRDINMDFKNIGIAGSFFQSMVSSVGTFLFDSIKPYILQEVNTNMRRDVNAKIKTITSKLPSYVSPVDLAVTEGRKYVVKMGYDPYHLRDFEYKQSILRINVSELWLKGLSQFYRVNDISLSIENNTAQIGIQLVTKRLDGSCSWTVTLGRRGKLSRTGLSNFTVEHLQIRAFVNQPLNIQHGPVLDDLDIEVGKVKLTMDGTGSLDYVIEMVVNQLPDLIRHIIVDALEEPIRNKVQSILNEINLKELVESKLPELDQLTT